MYTENNNGGLIKNIILKLLFLALFIFLILWLYPMPNTKPFYDAIFNNNINLMKEVAEDYYTVQRLPEKIGEKSKLTLKQMLDKKLLLPFVDKNGEFCDVEKSYVQVTKLENDEYELKVNLSCKDQTDYIIEYLGCHDLCKDGKCEKVVEVLEYKFVRELFKGRKEVTVDSFKYEFTKQESEAYTDKQDVTYYKGRKKASDDVYSYEYTKTEEEKYEEYNNVTYYKGRLKATDDVYSYLYTKQENVLKTRDITVTLYKGRKANYVYSYEYYRTEENSSCTNYYNQSSYPANAVNVSRNVGYIDVNDGYTYGAWTTVSSFTSYTPVATYSNDTERVLSDGYYLETSVCNKSNCPKSKTVYKYIRQTRTKTAKTKKQEVVTYNYQICTQTSEKVYTWSTEDLTKQGWTKTGNSQLDSSKTTYVYTNGWVETLPAGYEQTDIKTETRQQQYYETITLSQWSTEDLTKQGWTKTNQFRLVTAGTYTYTDWVKVLPAGYELIDKKTVTETVIKTKTVTKTEWSTEDLTKQGWTKTGESKLIKAGSYVYTDWVKVLPAGYEQTDKKTVSESITKYRTVTRTEWSTEDLTKTGWTKTGKSEKIGSTKKYVYTDWVVKLPAGYEQVDKKTETKWSTEETISGWTKTTDSRVKE